MPLFGQLDAQRIAAAPRPAPGSRHSGVDACRGAEILQLAWEVRDETLDLLPRAMHPAMPPYATLVVTRYPESPVGPFNLALLRLMGRAGAHPRGYVIAAVASTPDAVHALRTRWGFPAELGGIALRRYHDQVTAVVTRNGEPVLEAALIDPEPISGGDVQYIHSLTLAQLPDGDRSTPHLVQVDPHYTLRKAERGRPKVRTLRGGGLER